MKISVPEAFNELQNGFDKIWLRVAIPKLVYTNAVHGGPPEGT